jgi:hypothetical protein
MWGRGRKKWGKGRGGGSGVGGTKRREMSEIKLGSRTKYREQK